MAWAQIWQERTSECSFWAFSWPGPRYGQNGSQNGRFEHFMAWTQEKSEWAPATPTPKRIHPEDGSGELDFHVMVELII